MLVRFIMVLNLYFYEKETNNGTVYRWYIAGKDGVHLARSPRFLSTLNKCEKEAKQASKTLNENEIIVRTIKKGRI